MARVLAERGVLAGVLAEVLARGILIGETEEQHLPALLPTPPFLPTPLPELLPTLISGFCPSRILYQVVEIQVFQITNRK